MPTAASWQKFQFIQVCKSLFLILDKYQIKYIQIIPLRRIQFLILHNFKLGQDIRFGHIDQKKDKFICKLISLCINIRQKTYKMKISYGFVFYFQVFMVIMTILLIILYFRPIRNMVFSFADKYKLFEGPIYNTIWWIIFAVISIILVDSVLTYWAIRETLEIDTKDMIVDNFDTIKANQHDDYIIIYKKLREYYMAERNFMLTSSTLFVMFVFRKFLSGFRKIYDNQFEPVVEEVKVKAN